MKYKFILILTFLFYSSFCYSQIDSSEQSQKRFKEIVNNPEGTEFWLCFPQNYSEPKTDKDLYELTLELFFTANTDSEITIQVEGIGYKKKINLPAGTVISHKIPSDAMIRSAEIIERLAVHVTSDYPISDRKSVV